MFAKNYSSLHIRVCQFTVLNSYSRSKTRALNIEQITRNLDSPLLRMTQANEKTNQCTMEA